MGSTPEFALPYSLVQELEMLLVDVPDRGDTVYRLRRFVGRCYAEGHQAGRLVGYEEYRRDDEFLRRPEKP